MQILKQMFIEPVVTRDQKVSVCMKRNYPVNSIALPLN